MNAPLDPKAAAPAVAPIAGARQANHAVATSRSPVPLASRLPNVGTTIFTSMSALAAEHGAVNLGQGFPDFDCDPALVEHVHDALRAGHNQYAPMTGVPALRTWIAAHVAGCYGRRYDAASEVTVTAGATQGLMAAIFCAVKPGDEVVVIEPCYDSYVPAIELAGGVPVFVTLQAPDYRIPLDAIAAAITPRTRLLVLNTPHNPTGRIWTAAEMDALADIVEGTDVRIVSDEVYEHIVFDGRAHESVARHPRLAPRAFVVSSFGKTLHTTGWKVGWVCAPAEMSAELRKVHQFMVFAVNTPAQHGIAAYLSSASPWRELPAFYARRRDAFRDGLARTRFELLTCEGTYFQCVRYDAISDLPEPAFARWLTTEIGVASIPVSAFLRTPSEARVIRFCFAKRGETLARALERLARL